MDRLGVIASPTTTERRLVSLDAFRGLTIILMVVVNSAGSSAVYGQLQHSAWHGLTLADLIFPSFIWIVGLTTTMSLGGRVGKVPRGVLVRQVLARAAKMYVLGLCLYAAPRFSLSTQRLTGVLQRIAICYLVGSLLYLFSCKRMQVVWIVVLLGGYWAVMTLVPAPGFAAGDLTVAGNLAHYVDRVMLGSHNYVSTKTWDPEGILSTLPAIATMLLGMMAGYELARPVELGARVRRLAIAGCLLVAGGVAMSYWFPINKKLWTSSFVLVAAGVDCLIFPAMAWWIDVKGRAKSARPLVIVGMNAIAIYMASELGDLALSLSGAKGWIFSLFFARLGSPQMGSLLYAVSFALAMWGVAYMLYRRGMFLRL